MILFFIFSLMPINNIYAQGAMVTVPAAEYQNMMAAQGGNCFDQLAQTMNQGMSNSFQAYQNQTNMLMDNANKRFTTLKDCRSELRQAWLDFQNKKNEHLKEQNALPVRIKKAELAYQTEVLKIQQDCRQQTDQDFAKYREGIYKQGALNDPTQLVNFNNRINSHRKTFYESCFRSPENRKRVDLLGQTLKLAIDEINSNMKTADDALESFTRQSEQIQADLVKTCEEQKELQAYNERLSAQVAARGNSMTRQQLALGLITSIGSCQDGGRVPAGTSPDTTRTGSSGGAMF